MVTLEFDATKKWPDLAPPASHRVALVTGARSGIGFHTAIALARAGFKVYAGIRRLEDGHALTDAAAKQGLAIVPIILDVTDIVHRASAIATIAGVDGRLDVLVNNAGQAVDGPLEYVTDAEMRSLFDVNVFGVFALTREALPLMREARRGRILFLSSMSGRMAMPAMGAYAASKFALEGLAEAWNLELQPFDIDVVLVEPGPYKTELFRAQAMGEVAASMVGQPGPYRRLIDRFLVLREAVKRSAGDPREVAEVIAKLSTARKVPLRVPVGTSARVRTLLRKVLPDSAISRVIGGLFAGGKGPISVTVKADREKPPSAPHARPGSRWGAGISGGGPTKR